MVCALGGLTDHNFGLRLLVRGLSPVRRRLFLRAAGLDPDEYTGFYVNIGLDRLVMMRYGVDDVRLFHSADLRFLKQFH